MDTVGDEWSRCLMRLDAVERADLDTTNDVPSRASTPEFSGPPRAPGDSRLVHDILEGSSDVAAAPAARGDGGGGQIHFPDEMDSGPTFCRFDDDKWLDEVENEGGSGGDNGAWCFLCEYSQDSADVDSNPDYTRLLGLIQKNYGKLRPIALCRMVQDFYRQRLMNCIEEPRDWSLASIYYHIERHRPEPITMTLDAVRTITSAMHLLKDHGMCSMSTLPDGSRQRSLHVSNTRLYLTLADRQQKLLGTLTRLGHTYSQIL